MNPDNLFDACDLLVGELQKEYTGWEGVRQFSNTPERLVRMYQEFCWPLGRIEEELSKQVRVFDDGYNEMLVTGPIGVWTLCPHHLLPCSFRVTIGYVPTGSVLGLSKFARIAEIFGKKPVMQEEYSRELADFLMEKLKPAGVAVYVTGSHGCMTSRGVRQHSAVTTSVLRGCFESEPATRAEFLEIARK